MLAVDTNVIIRYVTGDDARQSAQARALVDNNDIVVAATVLLEAEWVLRRVYGYPKDKAIEALKAFSGLPTVGLGQPGQIIQAFDWAMHGMDFADALHMAASRECTAFISFDRDLAKAARRIAELPVRAP